MENYVILFIGEMVFMHLYALTWIHILFINAGKKNQNKWETEETTRPCP